MLEQKIQEHFEANMLDGQPVVEGRSMLEAKHVLEYIQEFYTLQQLPQEATDVKKVLLYETGYNEGLAGGKLWYSKEADKMSDNIGQEKPEADIDLIMEDIWKENDTYGDWIEIPDKKLRSILKKHPKQEQVTQQELNDRDNDLATIFNSQVKSDSKGDLYIDIIDYLVHKGFLQKGDKEQVPCFYCEDMSGKCTCNEDEKIEAEKRDDMGDINKMLDKHYEQPKEIEKLKFHWDMESVKVIDKINEIIDWINNK